MCMQHEQGMHVHAAKRSREVWGIIQNHASPCCPDPCDTLYRDSQLIGRCAYPSILGIPGQQDRECSTPYFSLAKLRLN